MRDLLLILGGVIIGGGLVFGFIMLTLHYLISTLSLDEATKFHEALVGRRTRREREEASR